jgi:hypothetical protein
VSAKKHADTFVQAVAILRLVERILRGAGTPPSKLAADMISDILRND